MGLSSIYGACTVRKLINQITLIAGNASVSYDCTALPDYQNLTSDNFIVQMSALEIKKSTTPRYAEFSVSYAPNTGTLTISLSIAVNFDMFFFAYAILGDFERV